MTSVTEPPYRPPPGFTVPRHTVRLGTRVQPTPPTHNLLVRPLSSAHNAQRKHREDKGNVMNMTTLSELKRLSVNSIGKQIEPAPKPKKAGIKYNRIKVFGIDYLAKKKKKQESLYEKSLKKDHSIHQRKDFNDSVREITAKRLLTSKRSLIDNEEPQRRLKTEVGSQGSAAIIIQLKRLFNNKPEYSFVSNYFNNSEEENSSLKRDEQIYSTNHTYYIDMDGPLSKTNSLHNRTRSGKRIESETLPKNKYKREKTSKENELIPWIRESQRAISELEFEPFLLE